MGQCAIVNGARERSPNLSIFGLGSCIALILVDRTSGLCGLSHILCPNSHHAKRNCIQFPHKYADMSVHALISSLVARGVEKKHLQAIVIGGAGMVQNSGFTIGAENIASTLKELKKEKITVVESDIGGMIGRVVMVNTQEMAVYVKKAGQNEFRKLFG